MCDPRLWCEILDAPSADHIQAVLVVPGSPCTLIFHRLLVKPDHFWAQHSAYRQLEKSINAGRAQVCYWSHLQTEDRRNISLTYVGITEELRVIKRIIPKFSLRLQPITTSIFGPRDRWAQIFGNLKGVSAISAEQNKIWREIPYFQKLSEKEKMLADNFKNTNVRSRQGKTWASNISTSFFIFKYS